jgi:hypothetical protein
LIVRHLHVLVEGQTEEIVVGQVIQPSLPLSDRAYLTLSIVKTKRPASAPAEKGGIGSWGKIYREVRLLLQDSSITTLTTLFDYYAFPSDAPGMSNRPVGSPYDRVRHVERAMAETIGDPRFLPHLVLHEIEAWVLADCRVLSEVMGESAGATDLLQAVTLESSPELVDDGPATAPSKRILDAYPNYRKTIDGPLVIAEVGLESIRLSCPHANAWLTSIETRLTAPKATGKY